MSDLLERPGVLSFATGLVRQALLDSRVGWVLRAIIGPRERALTTEDIISLNSRAFPENIKLPDHFLEKFKELPQVPMEHMLRMLGWKDMLNLQIVAGPFADYTGNARRNYPMNDLLQGCVKLEGTEIVTILRYNKRLDITHDQFVKSLQKVRVRDLMIKQKGTLRAASYHISELRCYKLQIRLTNPLDAVEENELAQVVEEIIVNPHITLFTLIARSLNPEALSARLYAITNRGRFLTPENAQISVISP